MLSCGSSNNRTGVHAMGFNGFQEDGSADKNLLKCDAQSSPENLTFLVSILQSRVHLASLWLNLHGILLKILTPGPLHKIFPNMWGGHGNNIFFKVPQETLMQELPGLRTTHPG